MIPDSRSVASRILSRGVAIKTMAAGTHQGAVSIEHLDGYLDEFAFRFNRHKSHSRGKLFYRLAQQAVAVEPITYEAIVRSAPADWS